jgi:hypothetical protein
MKAFASAYLLFFLLLAWLPPGSIQAQSGSPENVRPAQSLPSVFILGEYDKQYEAAMPGYITLLEACDGEMKTAFDKLMMMMREMEAYATLEKYDIKGINAWMHFFWREDGSIEHIGFYLKPNSRNVDTEKLRNFLNGFANWYKIPVQSGKKFAHYSSFAFPIAFLHTSDSEKSTVKKGDNSNY